MPRRDELHAYVMLSKKHVHTKKSVTAGCHAETVRDGCLSQPLGFRLSDSAHYCQQAEALI